ncbi:hypothetical protein D3C86_2078360 [compost metagenome]
MGDFDKGVQTTYDFKKKGNGVYAFILKGDFTINGQELNERDGLGVWDVQQLDITANSEDASILLMEVPMTLTQA